MYLLNYDSGTENIGPGRSGRRRLRHPGAAPGESGAAAIRRLLSPFSDENGTLV